MANPQKEDGFTPIANEILEALIRRRLSSYETSVVLFVIRKTYGFGKKHDNISISQFIEGTGIIKTHVCRTLRLLIKQNMVTKGGTKAKPVYSLQKDYEKWGERSDAARKHSGNVVTKGGHQQSDRKGSPNRRPKGVTSGDQRGLQQVTKGGTHKRNYTKETLQKDATPLKPPREDQPIVDCIEAFREAGNEKLSYGNPHQRAAAKRLLEKHGEDWLHRVTEFATAVQQKPYAPDITSPIELESKLQKLRNYWARENNSRGGVAFVS